jgi:hypothetical protein
MVPCPGIERRYWRMRGNRLILLAGHRKPETTAKYAHVLDDMLLDGLNLVGDAREKKSSECKTAAAGT